MTVPLLFGLLLGSAGAQDSDKRSNKETEQSTQFKFLDSTEAQWGRRSVNDSVYLGYPVNAVYQERGRQRLPDSFKGYRPGPIDHSSIVQKTKSDSELEPLDAVPSRIRVNGSERPLESD